MLRRNVLIFHLGALGDFVLTWPLAMALARLHPQSRIIYVTHGQKGALAERVLRVESVDVESGWHALFGTGANLPELPRKLIHGSHSIINFMGAPHETWIGNVRAADPRADIILLEPRPPGEYPGHFTDYLVEQLGPFAALQASTAAMLRLLAERGIPSRNPRGRTILIHPGSGAQHKCWPADRFIALIRMIRQHDRPVRIVLGEVELEKWGPQRVAQFESLGEVVRPATLVELYEQMATSAAAVVNDSGPAHLSGISGTPTLVLFGASNPTIWRPLGPRVELIHRHPLESIEPAEVYERLVALSEDRTGQVNG